MAAKKTMDFSQPYGEIFGQLDGVVGARYQQGNSIYDANGKLLKTLDGDVVDQDVQEQNEQAREELLNPEPVLQANPQAAPVEPTDPGLIDLADEPKESQLPEEARPAKPPVLPKSKK